MSRIRTPIEEMNANLYMLHKEGMHPDHLSPAADK